MKILSFKVARVLLASVSLVAGAGASHAAGTADLRCTLKYQLKGWSAVYSQAEGSGTVTCADGASKNVMIKVHSVGAALGRSQVDNGVGKFTDVRAIDDVLGSYAQTSVDAGVIKSGAAQVLTKGTVSLALAGGGEGIDLGITIGALTLSAAP